MVDTVEALVDGGKATAGPPLGPALGPKGVDIGKIITAINDKTAVFAGMKVPVKILIADDKSFEMKVGSPPMSALIKSELNLAKGSSNNTKEFVGNMTLDQAKNLAKMKEDSLLGATEKARVLEVAGAAVTVGVTIDGKKPKDFQAAVKAGEYDSQF